MNNAQGHFFEDAIKAGCALYSRQGRAEIDKTPEPFRVMEKSGGGIFKGRFTARAQPDFQGTLAGGRSIVFEAKHTNTSKTFGVHSYDDKVRFRSAPGGGESPARIAVSIFHNSHYSRKNGQ